MKQILFFALKQDILAALEMVESGFPLKYVRTGNFESPETMEYLAAKDIPCLGEADSDAAITCASYLVCHKDLRVSPLPLIGEKGESRYLVDQRIDADSAILTPAGMRKGEAILHGRVATAYDSAASREYLNAFSSALKKNRFAKVKSFWVGQQALGFLGDGGRLTISVSSPREFDLRK